MNFKYEPAEIILTIMLVFLLPLFLFNSCDTEEYHVNSNVIEEEIIEVEEEGLPEDEDTEVKMILVNDSFDIVEGSSLTLNILSNDSDVFNDAILVFTDPLGGVLNIDDNNTPSNVLDDIITYQSNSGFIGEDSFDYTICDFETGEICKTASVIVTISSKPIGGIDGELKAFPSAFGAGAIATGGRGGKVIHVKNLNDSGADSFREALNTSGARIIVFDVSGEIHLQSRIWVSGAQYGNLTIAGQTAPAGGITITGHDVNIMQCSNVIVRYLRFRNAEGNDGLALRGDGNVIVDHCSFAWAKDEAIDITSYNIENVTVQNCHFYNNAKAMILGSGSDDTGMIGDFSVLKNTSASTSHRFPNFSGNGKLDVINNLIHNWRYRSVMLYANNWEANIIGNHFQSGVNTLASALNTAYSNTWGKDRLVSGIYKIICNETMSPTLYCKYNRVDKDLIDIYQNAWDSDSFNQQSSSNNGWTSIDLTEYSETNEFSSWTAFYTEATSQPKLEWFSESQLPLLGIEPIILSNSELKNELLPTTGSCKTLNADGTINFWRDSIDTNSISEIENDGSQTIIFQTRSGYGENQTYTSNSRSLDYDSDKDGMADVWERAMFDDLSKTASGDEDNDGYTNIEEFINLVDKL